MTPTQRKAMEQALEALNDLRGYRQDIDDAIGALVEALAEQPAEPQEPVAWGIVASNTGRICQVELDADEVADHNPARIVPLYTAPQPAKQPLTDEEIYECERIAAIRHHRHKNSIRGQQITPADDPQWHFARAIERAHGITGETK